VPAPRTIAPQPWMTAPATRKVMAALAADGAEARFVGGCVRDALLGVPVKDIDIATHETPERVIALLERAGIKAVPTGIAHGTVTAVVGEEHFEITTLRRDVRPRGRHADVAFTDDWAEDAARRDFTINALSLAGDGTVFDPFGGLDDLARGRVRFVGDAETRIREDVLRLLRYFRFFAWYDRPPPDAEALAAARKLAPLLPSLSAERVWAELRRILAAPDPAAVLTLMAGEGVLAHVLPEARRFDVLAALATVEAAEGLGGAGADPVRRLAAVIAPDPEAAAGIAARLRLSRADGGRLAALAREGAAIAPDCTGPEARRAVYRFGQALYRDLVLLSWAAEKAEGGGRQADAAYAALLEVGVSFRPPALPVKGKDALALGLAPGPAVGKALAEVEAWWMAEDFRPDRAACLARLREEVEGG